MSNPITPEAIRDEWRAAVRKAQKSWRCKYYMWRITKRIKRASAAGEHCCYWDHMFMNAATTAVIVLALRRVGLTAELTDPTGLRVEWRKE